MKAVFVQWKRVWSIINKPFKLILKRTRSEWWRISGRNCASRRHQFPIQTAAVTSPKSAHQMKRTPWTTFIERGVQHLICVTNTHTHTPNGHSVDGNAPKSSPIKRVVSSMLDFGVQNAIKINWICSLFLVIPIIHNLISPNRLALFWLHTKISNIDGTWCALAVAMRRRPIDVRHTHNGGDSAHTQRQLMWPVDQENH